MKVGSLVEYIKKCPIDDEMNDLIKWLPIVGNVYIIRGIGFCKENEEHIVFLEEGKIGMSRSGKYELGIPVEFFRELQPPMDLTELIEETLLITV